MLQHRRSFVAIALASSFAFACATTSAYGQSGQRTFAQASVEPAIDYSTGSTIYLLTPVKAPLPSLANTVATAPLYLVLYPLSSAIAADDLNCQPNNCDHANVLPFPSPDYGVASAQACADFNGGQPCAWVKGHDHLVGAPRTKGDFNVAWTVKPVVFTHQAFVDGKINDRILTLNQLWAEVASGDVVIAPDVTTFNCSITSARTYALGTTNVIPFP